MNVADVGLADHLQMILLEGRVQESRDQLLQHFLADIAGEAGLHHRQRSLARTETRQPHLHLNRRGGALGFLIHLGLRNRDLERMLATFNKSHLNKYTLEPSAAPSPAARNSRARLS